MEKKIVQTAGRNPLGEFTPKFAYYNDEWLALVSEEAYEKLE